MSKEKIIFALDVPSKEEALELVSELEGEVGAFKIGLQLFTAEGASFVRQLVGRGCKVFLDVKYHDIPNTVAAASVEAARLGVWMFNVHASGGEEMMKRTVDEVHTFCSAAGIDKPKLIAVTVLTSADSKALRDTGIELNPAELVVKYAKLAESCGMDGVVASPLEAGIIRSAVSNDDFLIVTPGIRPAFATNDDQKRVTTPGAAIRNGADYLVVGRPIRKAGDRVGAARRISEEISS